MKKLVVVDAFSLIYKAYYAVRLMHTSAGTPTNAVYGFVNMLLKLIKDVSPDYMFVAFDSGKTFRHEEYEAYKAQRAAMPEELKTQIPYIKDILNKAGVAVITAEGYEADDIVGLISSRAAKDEIEALVVTGDRDSFQLVKPNITVLYAKKGVSDTVNVDEAYIAETYGVTPTQLVDVKSLMGDASDNIPGVSGVGEKTALSLIKQYGSLKGVYDNIGEIKGKLKEKLELDKEKAFLSRDLAEIRTDFPLEYDYSSADDFNFASAGVIEILSVLEMNNLIKQLGGEIKTESADKITFENKTLTTLPDIKQLYGKTVAVCLASNEETGTLSVCIADEKNSYVNETNAAYLKQLYGAKEISIVTHDFKEQYKQLLKFNIEVKNLSLDTYIAAYLISATDDRYDINTLTKKYLGITLPEKSAFKQQSFFDNVSAVDNDMLSDETRAVYMLKDELNGKLVSDGMLNLYRDIEQKLIFVLAEMELQGFKADKNTLRELDRNYDAQKGAIETRIQKLTGYDNTLNLNSSKQLAWLLYEDLELPVVKKTKGGGGYSTDNEALEKLKDKHEVVPLLIEYRQVTKLSSTYIKGMLKLIDETGRIHSSFNQTVTTTGRISSSNPNLQNIPVRTREGREIRKVFVPSDENHTLVDADYSQIELRVLAHISADENMCEAFRNGEDIHSRTASEVFGVKLSEVTSEQRARAKAVNFGIVYGISDYGLAKNIDIKRFEAKEYIDRYLQRFPKVKQYMHDIVVECEENGYVSTMFNRRRYIPEIKSANFNIRAFAQRTALNTPIQGSAADIIKIAMVKAADALKQGGYSSRLILQVHDELIIDCLKTEEKEVTALLKNEMENAAKLIVPLSVEIKSGASWYETK